MYVSLAIVNKSYRCNMVTMISMPMVPARIDPLSTVMFFVSVLHCHVQTICRRPFMARMVAQRNSRGFQSTLLGREHVLDKHILHLLEKFSDPSFFKKKHGYNVHGQMLGKDGKMIVKVSHEEPTRPVRFLADRVLTMYLSGRVRTYFYEHS